MRGETRNRRQRAAMSRARAWALAAAVLAPGTLLAGSLAALMLDALVHRPPNAGSITTVLPGFTYASATVMKVSLAAGLVSALMAVAARVLSSAPDAPTARRSTWALASVALPAAALVAGTIGVLIAQPRAGLVRDFTYVSRTGVFVQSAVIAAGAIAAAIALTRAEHPRLLPLLGVIVNGLLLALFWSLEFYAVGFDQDTWAPR